MERSNESAHIDGNVTVGELIQRTNLTILEYFDNLELDDLDHATTLADIGADSLDVLEIQVLLETEFGFKDYSDEGIRAIKSLNDVYAWVAWNILKASDLLLVT